MGRLPVASSEVEEKAIQELKRLESMPPMSAEATVSRNYVDWLIAVPWYKKTRESRNLARAEQILHEDHYGLSDPGVSCGAHPGAQTQRHHPDADRPPGCRENVVGQVGRPRHEPEVRPALARRRLTGTDNNRFAGSSLHWELEYFVQAGIPPLDVLRIATQEAAAAVGADDHLGTLEVGKLADIVLLDENPLDDIRNTQSIWRTIKGGWVFDPDELRPPASSAQN